MHPILNYLGTGWLAGWHMAYPPVGSPSFFFSVRLFMDISAFFGGRGGQTKEEHSMNLHVQMTLAYKAKCCVGFWCWFCYF